MDLLVQEVHAPDLANSEPEVGIPFEVPIIDFRIAA